MMRGAAGFALGFATGVLCVLMVYRIRLNGAEETAEALSYRIAEHLEELEQRMEELKRGV